MPTPLIRPLVPGDEAALEAFLKPRLAFSMFLLSNLRTAGLAGIDHPYAGTYVAAFEAGQIVAVVAHYWRHQTLILQAPAYLDKLWPAALESSGRPLKGLIGPGDQVEQVKTALNIKQTDCQLNETEGLYSLDLAKLHIPDILQSGKIRGRRIEAGDLDLVTAWRVAYSIEALGETDSPELRARCRATIERSHQDGQTWILEAEGRPVASTSFNAVIKEAVQVGGVWTPPDLRRRGYARAVVAASLLDAWTEGASQAILFTGDDNIPAQRAYQALGFQRQGDYCLLLLHSPLFQEGA